METKPRRTNFTAKYSGWCGLCGDAYAMGDLIQRINPVTRKVPTKTERYQPANDFEMLPKLLKYGHRECPQ